MRGKRRVDIRVIAAGDTPQGLALDPRHGHAYLANNRMHAFLGHRRAGTVSVVDLVAGTEIEQIKVGRRCIAVAAHPSRGEVYAANLGSNSVSIIDTAVHKETARIGVGPEPRALTVSPAGDRVYVAGIGGRTVSVLDPQARAVTATIEVGEGPCAFAQSPGGDRLYVANFRKGTVSVVDTRTLTATATVPVGDGPGALAISPDGDRLYVACRWSQAITVVDTGTCEVSSSITTQTLSTRRGVSLGVAMSRPQPYGIALSRDGALLLVALWEPGTVIVIDTATERRVEEYDLDGGKHGRGPVDIVADPVADRWLVACVANAVAVLTR
ncbi:hypothetical protein Asp14428_67250 [Actinoplanes sp. NBRC 14428]|nr:hypothetical protein Asp14428_67250 [Actinoplanes sp. NBRC 14428]